MENYTRHSHIPTNNIVVLEKIKKKISNFSPVPTRREYTFSLKSIWLTQDYLSSTYTCNDFVPLTNFICFQPEKYGISNFGKIMVRFDEHTLFLITLIFIYLFITYSLTYSFIHLFIHSFIHSFIKIF